MALIRFVVGFLCFAMGCSTLLQIASGKYFADLPPHADSAELWGSVLAATLTLALGAIGFKMLTSLLRPEQQEQQTNKNDGPSLMAVLRSIARKTVGFILVLLATSLFVDCLKNLPHASMAELTGQILAAVIFPLIMGYVGTKMMLRGDMPGTPSPAPSPQ